MVMLEETVMSNVRQVDSIWGWRRQIFDQLGGPDLVRSSFDRLVLLKQARDIMRKITILKESPLIPDDERSRIDQFIASTALLDSRQGEWFAESVAVLRILKLPLVKVTSVECMGWTSRHLEEAHQIWRMCPMVSLRERKRGRW